MNSTELKNIRTLSQVSNHPDTSDLTTNVSHKLNTSIESIKQEFESFRTHV